MKKKFLSEEDIQNLKYVKVSNPKMNVSHFPDFMIVGPLRTGTTWLHRNLSFHPQIFMSDPKEIYFFYTLKNPNSSRYESSDLAWYLSFFYDTPTTYFKKNLIAFRKYKELYEPKMRGESSASYAILDKAIIKEIVTLNPEIKIILMIRNPIDAAWSHAKLEFLIHGGKKYSEVSDKEFEKFFHEDYVRAFGNYTTSIKNWNSFLRGDNLFVGIFDDIKKSPVNLLLRILTFLGVRSNSKYIGLTSREKVNRSESIEVPVKYKVMLKEIFKDELERLKDSFGLSWE
jgi:hypothetical protein